MDTRQRKATGSARHRSAGRTMGGTTTEQRPVRASRSPQTVRTNRKAESPAKVAYTPAKPFRRKRFLLQLATVAAVAVAVVLGMSVFFKVETVTVFGNEKYSAWTIREASGIQDKENLLTLGRTRAVSRILDRLPYVKQARIAIQLPSTVNIYLEEVDVVYAVQEELGAWWLIRSDGVAVEQTDAASASDYTRILGLTISKPAAGQSVVAAEAATVSETTGASEDPTGETQNRVTADFSAGEKLNVALKILASLEENSIIGQADSIDVSNLTDLELWYEDRYQVKLGDTGELDYKIWYMKRAIDQMADYQSGLLDVSFTIWTDQAGFQPF